ncbi:MAG: TerD family protein [Burkholderiaceae bacterium]
MTSLVLNLTKPGEQAAKLQLNLNKNEVFSVKLSWDERAAQDKTDLDLHAIVGVNTGSGAKASAFEDILSTYNVRRKIGGQEVGVLDKKADGSFEIHGGALVHSPDAQDGNLDGDDEWIRIDPSKLTTPAQGHLEIPLVAMIHGASVARRFGDVKNARVTVVNLDRPRADERDPVGPVRRVHRRADGLDPDRRRRQGQLRLGRGRLQWRLQHGAGPLLLNAGWPEHAP